MQIVLCYPVESHHIDQIAAVVPDAKIINAQQEEIPQAIFEADIFCGHPKVPMPWADVVAQGRLQWIQSSAAGLDHCLVPVVIDSDIIVTSASGVLSDQVAEHTMALVTGWTRSMPVFYHAQQVKEYIRRPTKDLTHSTVGIVGFGGVGRRIAEVMAPFKTRLLAVDLYPVDQPEHVEALWHVDQLDRLLAESDIVILSLPLTAVTREMFTAELFAKMKPGCLFVNMARGALVVEPDLIAALDSGHLAGAVMDVAAKEPLPPESKLWEMPNVILTPHVAGQSRLRIDNMTNFFCDNLQRYLTKQPLRNLVDKQQGFPVRQGKPAG